MGSNWQFSDQACARQVCQARLILPSTHSLERRRHSRYWIGSRQERGFRDRTNTAQFMNEASSAGKPSIPDIASILSLGQRGLGLHRDRVRPRRRPF